jgi:hypothetical protein
MQQIQAVGFHSANMAMGGHLNGHDTIGETMDAVENLATVTAADRTIVATIMANNATLTAKLMAKDIEIAALKIEVKALKA